MQISMLEAARAQARRQKRVFGMAHFGPSEALACRLAPTHETSPCGDLTVTVLATRELRNLAGSAAAAAAEGAFVESAKGEGIAPAKRWGVYVRCSEGDSGSSQRVIGVAPVAVVSSSTEANRDLERRVPRADLAAAGVIEAEPLGGGGVAAEAEGRQLSLASLFEHGIFPLRFGDADEIERAVGAGNIDGMFASERSESPRHRVAASGERQRTLAWSGGASGGVAGGAAGAAAAAAASEGAAEGSAAASGGGALASSLAEQRAGAHRRSSTPDFGARLGGVRAAHDAQGRRIDRSADVVETLGSGRVVLRFDVCARAGRSVAVSEKGASRCPPCCAICGCLCFVSGRACVDRAQRSRATPS